jgi:hypothetical protein
MRRRQMIASLGALLGAGRARAAAPQEIISKNSTRCEVSEMAAQGGVVGRTPIGTDLSWDGSGHAGPTRGRRTGPVLPNAADMP